MAPSRVDRPLSARMSQIKGKIKGLFSGADNSPSSQPTTSVPIPDYSRQIGRVNSAGDTLTTKQPSEIATTSTSSAVNHISINAALDEDASFISNPALCPIPNEVAQGAAPIVKEDSPKTTAWNIFRATLAVTKEIATAIPFAQLGGIIGGLITVLDKFEAADGNLSEIEAITRHIARIQTIVGPLKDNSTRDIPHLTNTLPSLVTGLERDLLALKTTTENRRKQPRWKRVAGSANDASIIKQTNDDLNTALHAFQTETILDIVNRLETQAQEELIRLLPRAHNAAYNSGLRANSGVTRCLENTQEATLDDIKVWSDNSHGNGPPIFWIWGMAGMGKSTIAQTVAEREADQGRLGASFFFSRDTKEQSDPLLLIPTLAYQLSHFNSHYKAHLAKALQPNPDISRGQIAHQLKALLVDPLSACKSFPSPVIIVIDALDECEPELVWKTIIRALAADVPDIQQNVRFLVTSRPENTLDSEFRSSALSAHSKSWKLHEIGESIISRDIERYLNHHLRRIASDHGLPHTWPDWGKRDALVKKSGMLFIVAATLIKFIDDPTLGPKAQLEELTKDSSLTHVLDREDALIVMYDTVIRLALRTRSPSATSEMSTRISELIKNVVGTIILVKNPMSNDTLTAFLEGKHVSGALFHLHSLFIIPATSDAPIRVLHQSFPEYLTNKDQCKHIYIDPAAGHARLAALCFKHMASLDRNPCEIDDLACLNQDISDLRQRTDKYIPLHIRYSCLRITDHLWAVSDPNDRHLLATALAMFCKSQLLVWIEVLSYLGQLHLAPKALAALRAWYSDTPNPSKQIIDLMIDAKRLLDRFRGLIHKAAGHVYLTALPWTASSALWSQYEPLTLKLHLPHYPERDDTLQHLALSFSSRFHDSKNGFYIDEAIRFGEEVLELRPHGHSGRVIALTDLARHLSDRYHLTKDVYDLSRAIDLSQEVLQLVPLGYPNRVDTQFNISLYLGNRYHLMEDVNDLVEAMRFGREALNLRPLGDPNRANALANVASLLGDCYRLTKVVSELSEAIDLGREALNLRPPGHSNRINILADLARHLHLRYRLTKDMNDYSEANCLHREILQIVPPGHPNRINTRFTLSVCNRYNVMQDVNDLCEAIRLGQEALDVLPPRHPDRLTSLVDLTRNLRDRYDITGDVNDISEAVRLGREALDLVPPDHPGHNLASTNLAMCLKKLRDFQAGSGGGEGKDIGDGAAGNNDQVWDGDDLPADFTGPGN